MTHDEPADSNDAATATDRPSAPAQVGVALATLAEAWLRDTAYCGLGLFSFVVVVCGFAAADGAGYGALGVVAGLVAFALPTVALVRKARVSRTWLALLAGALLDAAAIALFVTS